MCLPTVQQSRDAVWNAELGRSREHVLHGIGNVDAPTGKGYIWGSGLFREISAKSGIFQKIRREILHFPREIRCALVILHGAETCLVDVNS